MSLTSDDINARLAEIADSESISPAPLAGKAIAYYGWYWRSVNFDAPITFAYADGGGWDVPSWVGFCENNKWGYDEFTCDSEQSAEVRRLCEILATEPTRENAQALFDYMQTTRPAHVTGASRWDPETTR
jgi:hypothetical protein